MQPESPSVGEREGPLMPSDQRTDRDDDPLEQDEPDDSSCARSWSYDSSAD